MSDPKTELNAIVVFSSRYGATEKLALAAGVGAVQARANIRLRRLADLASPDEIARDAQWSENVQRMGPDYIAPRPIDNDWAHVVILAAPVNEVPESAALTEMLAYLASCPNMVGKLAVVLTSSKELFGQAALAGFTVVPPPRDGFKDAGDATAFGRRACETARALRLG